jgi:hypothetical protein
MTAPSSTEKRLPEIRAEVARCRQTAGRRGPRPVWRRSSSATTGFPYLRQGQAQGVREAGIESFGHELPATATQAEVEALVVVSTRTRRFMGSWCSFRCRPGWMRKPC